MTVAVTGSAGLVGSALLRALSTAGHETARIVRGSGFAPGAIRWDPDRGSIDAAGLEGQDAVVHLAGENIAAGRWTPARKAAIRESRVRGTGLLAETLSGLSRPPKVLVCASAVGFYGDRGDEVLTEESGPGVGFLPEVCGAWEAAAAPAAAKGIRVVSLRIGMVLSTFGGALARMRTPFRLGLGGVFGSGSQWMSWITLDDLVGVVLHALSDDTLRGPVNAVAPSPVTNREFTRVLAKVLRRPAFVPVPAFALRLVAGEMADALLLSSARVLPEKLEASRFRFRHPDLEGALRSLPGW